MEKLTALLRIKNVDRVPPLNDDSQDDTQFDSSGDDLQAFIDEFDLTTSNQDAIRYTILTHTPIYVCM